MQQLNSETPVPLSRELHSFTGYMKSVVKY